jgi:hypothetical protein
MQATVVLTRTALESLFEAIFGESVTVYTSDSRFGEKTRTFASPSEALEYLEGEQYVGYALHYPDVGGYIEDRLVKLDPAKCQGHAFRHSMGGWGLIHLQLKKKRDGVECKVAVNTSKRAAAWASTYPELKDPALWKWPMVEKHARKLIRRLESGAT